MVLIREIKAEMIRKGINHKELAKLLEISERTLTNRFKKQVFNSNEILKIIKILDLKNPAEIFFAD